MQFTARIKNQEGVETVITREAKDRFEIAHTLRREGFTVVSVVAPKTSYVKLLQDLFSDLRRVSLREKIVFAQNLGAMITAGLPLSRALAVFERQVSNPRFKEIIQATQRSVDRGESLSEALGKYPKIFTRVFVSMVKAGEESGKLPDALHTVSTQLEKTYSLRKKIRGALMYPSIIIITMIGIGIFMAIYVVPTLTSSFSSLNASLPASTQLVLVISNFLVAHTILFFVSLILLIVGGMYCIRSASGKRLIDRLVLRMPLFSKLAKESNAATLCRTLASLISSGVDMVEALGITAQVMNNSLYRDSLLHAQLAVQKGLPLSGIFREDAALYPPLVSAMGEVGEETGRLAEMLTSTAVFYEEEVDTAARNLGTIIEPILMVVIGIVVGFFALAMIQPLYSITEHI